MNLDIAFNHNDESSPLNLTQINRIEELTLSALEKHHLRLLAHCLQVFKSIPVESDGKNFPSKQEQLEWWLSNPKLKNDREFILLLIEQFDSAAIQLERVAKALQILPMQLTLDDLIFDAISRSSNSSSQ